MPKIHLYKLFNKHGYVLFLPRHPFFAEERMARYRKVYRGENTEMILHTESEEDFQTFSALPGDFLKVERDGSFLSLTPTKTATEVLNYIKEGFLDTAYKEDALIFHQEKQRHLFYHYGRFRMRGFYGILHRLFPIVFIMHGIPGFQPMTWDMIIGDPYFEDRNYMNLLHHYQEIENGMEEMLENVTLRVVENTALKQLNQIVREDRHGEGFNQAARVCTILGLGFLKDFYWPATQATEKSEWTKFLRPPIPLFPWQEQGDRDGNARTV